MHGTANLMPVHSGGSGAFSSLPKKDINIYPESSTFISDQTIFQWKEEKKNANLDRNTKDSEKHLIHPQLLSWALLGREV